MKRASTALLTAVPLGLAACSETVDVPATPTFVAFSTSEGTLPVPNDLLFSGTLDATLNFPDAEDPLQQPLLDALNSLDGWSTVAPISFSTNQPFDPATLVAGQSVRLFVVTTAVNPNTGLTLGTPVTDVVRELATPAEYVVVGQPGDTTAVVLPTRPLAPRTSYMLVVTNALQDADGAPVRRGESYLIASLDDADNPLPNDHPLVALRPLVHAMEGAAATDGDVVPPIAREDIAVTATFTTQSTADALSVVATVALGGEALVTAGLCPQLPFGCDDPTPANTVPAAAVVPTAIGTTADFIPFSAGLADVYVGSLTLPYYLTAAANSGGLVQDTAPLTEHWRARYAFYPGDPDRNVTRYNPLPLETGAETVPVLITLPNGASGQTQPGGGWPVVIFQHGITRNRSDLLALADALAQQGLAAVAIDMPLHGIPDAANPLHVGVVAGGLRERTFGLDLVTQDVDGNLLAAAPDGVADSSGAHFINLTSLQTQRDNLRQAVADLFAVEKLIVDNLDVDGVGLAADFDATQVSFVGQSLGAMVGAVFTAVDAGQPTPRLTCSALSAPGGGIANLLLASESFGPTILAGLAALGLEPGTADFDRFVFAVQTVIDSGDPINHAAILAGGATTPVLLHEVVGGGPGGGLPDQVIPNAVATAPLSGTEPLIAALDLSVVSATTVTPAAAVRFWEGTHASLLNPDPDGDLDPQNLVATVEMQAEVVGWILAAGTQVTVGNNGPSGVVAP
ncbi:MAG: hypothetical protein H6828_09395 [Planctomycetes bacterium]|nr:hypothetical protein [Planctomycetota bacterium]